MNKTDALIIGQANVIYCTSIKTNWPNCEIVDNLGKIGGQCIELILINLFMIFQLFQNALEKS